MKKYIKYSVGAIFCAMILSLHFYNAFFTGYGVLTNESLHVSITAQTNGGECSNCTNGSCGQCPPPACSNCTNGTCGECPTGGGDPTCPNCTNTPCTCGGKYTIEQKDCEYSGTASAWATVRLFGGLVTVRANAFGNWSYTAKNANVLCKSGGPYAYCTPQNCPISPF